MKYKNLLFAAILFFMSQSLFAQVFDKENFHDTTDTWTRWRYLIGNWVGEDNGQPGQGKGSFSFDTDLDNNILTRKSKTVFPATQKRQAFVHSDLLIVYPDTAGYPSKAIYFDNEGHVLNYSITYTDSSIVMTGNIVEGLPNFRLSYVKLGSKEVNVKFEISFAPERTIFKTYLEGKAVKKD